MVGKGKERKEGGRSQCLGGTEQLSFIHILILPVQVWPVEP
jgi:hypothetical protein